MAAAEDQAEPVIRDVVLPVLLRLGELHGRRVPLAARGFAAESIDGAIARRGDDPAGRRGRYAAAGPALERGLEGVLHRFLGERDVAQRPHEHGHGAAVLAAEHLLDLPAQGVSMKGRTSMGVPMARASLRPQPSAASRSGASRMVIPPICSLVSMKGPSVVTISPPKCRNTVAVSAGCRPPENTQTPADCISRRTASTSRMILCNASGAGCLPPTG